MTEAEYLTRVEAYRKRSTALHKAIEQGKSHHRMVEVTIFFAFVVANVIFWPTLTAKHVVLLVFGAFALKWLAYLAISLLWSDPLMKKIDENFPIPPKENPLLKGLPSPPKT